MNAKNEEEYESSLCSVLFSYVVFLVSWWFTFFVGHSGLNGSAAGKPRLLQRSYSVFVPINHSISGD